MTSIDPQSPFDPQSPWTDIPVQDASLPSEDLYSATTLDQWENCQRKVAWTKFDGLPRPPSGPSAALGSDTHAQLADYLSDAKPFQFTNRPSGGIALSALNHLPRPRDPNLQVEAAFGFSYYGVAFKGAKDLSFPGWLVDHKTTKDFKWKKHPDKLAGTGIYANGGIDELGERADLQSAIYAYDEIFRQGLTHDQPLNCRWLYLRTTGGPKAEPVDFQVTVPQLIPTMNRAHALAISMGNARRAGLRALDLPPNPAHCDAFGGCPFKNNCNLSADEKFEALMTQSYVSEQKTTRHDMTQVSDQHNATLAELQARQAAANGAAHTAHGGPAINPPPPSGPPAWWPQHNKWVNPGDADFGFAIQNGAFVPPPPGAPALAPAPYVAPPPQAAPYVAPPPQGPPPQAAPYVAPTPQGPPPGAYVQAGPPAGTELIPLADPALEAIVAKFASGLKLVGEAMVELSQIVPVNPAGGKKAGRPKGSKNVPT